MSEQQYDKKDFVNITGLAMYAKIFEPSAPYEGKKFRIPARWQTDILLKKSDADELIARGLLVKDNNDKYNRFVENQNLKEKGYLGHFIPVTKNVMKKKWDEENQMVVRDANGNDVLEPAEPPKIMDSAGNIIPETANLLVGNGSSVEAFCKINEGKGIHGEFTARLINLTIKDLVEIERRETGTFVFSDTGEEVNDTEAPVEEVADMQPDNLDDLLNGEEETFEPKKKKKA